MLIFALFLHEKHDAVTSGKAYGYEIGQSQKFVFERIKSLAPKEDYKVLYVSYQEGMNSRIDIIPIAELNFENIAILNQWDVTIGSKESLLNGIRFNFENDRLVQIYRHRQAFELP